VGALLGNASHQVAVSLRGLGILIGEIVQISDDLSDAFQTPASPDWTQGRPSLPILYASTADHPDRARFMDLLLQGDDPQALREAQQILVKMWGRQLLRLPPGQTPPGSPAIAGEHPRP